MQTTTTRSHHLRRLSSLASLTPRYPTPLLDWARVVSTRAQLQEVLDRLYALASPVDDQAFAALFHACARHRCLEQGEALHRYMLLNQNGPPDLFVSNHLVNMYAKCGDLEGARKVFDDMPHRNHVSWTALVSGYAQHGRGDECFSLFSGMLAHHRPNEFAFASVLSSCRECDGDRGRQVHALALKMSLNACLYVGNSLIAMYSKTSGRQGGFDEQKDEAWTVFRSMESRNLITWNSMIAGFELRGLGRLAIDLFAQMHTGGYGFDRATLLGIFSSLSGSSNASVGFALNCCLQLHCLTVKTGFTSEVEVTTALVKAYSDLGGDAADCYKLFLETNSHKDVICWTGIITALAEREPEESFFLFRQLLREGISPDWYTFSSVLKACAGLMTEKHALSVHCRVIKSGFDGDTVLANSLIHAYARCSCMASSKQVFDLMDSRDLISWSSMLKAYALHGQGKEALQLFVRMNFQPDSTTFVALLSACSHAGLVENGISIFDAMSTDYDVAPQLDHYACMVDILGRAGRVLEAQELINRMPMQPDSVVWSALLGACRKHGNAKLAKTAAIKLKELEPSKSLAYVQLSNICCSGGRFDEAGLIRSEMNRSRVKKEPGLSWIEIGNQIHEFASGGWRHPMRDKIYAKLNVFIGKLKELGYTPETCLALHDLEEEHKEEQLYYHSEKLALVFATMNESSLPTVIKIMKNIRICVDCHNFMKIAADLLNREIVVRDSNRFHHFKSRVCSCNDYW
ncbi:pentatricopeptide repeat-containing protein At1g71420 [Syzygium oleosum]|uniref:pentatricopeptide repeat-containing protein At1g71420 n=1 Tax=Syzygium oleosum TaxID=219896 RepID=UPI0024B9686B|nr:pentatricopeptide repeat-containing protein At1g71420 [Syzygium oleosum]